MNANSLRFYWAVKIYSEYLGRKRKIRKEKKHKNKSGKSANLGQNASLRVVLIGEFFSPQIFSTCELCIMIRRRSVIICTPEYEIPPQHTGRWKFLTAVLVGDTYFPDFLDLWICMRYSGVLSQFVKFSSH